MNAGGRDRAGNDTAGNHTAGNHTAGARDSRPGMRFRRALEDSPDPIIMEVKRRSASGRDLLGDRSVRDTVEDYHRAGAPCISVVTGKWFGGTAELLQEVRAHTDLPLLQKDFFTRRAELEAAERAGASAVLLTATLLDRESLNTLIDHTLEIGLLPFVEVLSEAEISSVSRPEACVIAVNNRNIREREAGPGGIRRSLELAPAVLASGTPLPVSASGIASRAHAHTLREAGYRGLLVGTSLLTDPAAWAHPTPRGEAS